MLFALPSMQSSISYLLLFLLCTIDLGYSYHFGSLQRNNCVRCSTKLCLFKFFGTPSANSTSNPVVASKPPDEKIAKLKSGLEKISNTQNRDWKAEAAKQAAAAKPPPPVDLQIKSYNFGKANEFPNLYKGWIKADGDQIAKQSSQAVKAALNKFTLMEVLFDPVPNLDEVAFGTAWNKKLRLEVANELKVPEYATNRGGPSTLEWSNIYWASRLVSGLNNPKTIALSISGEGLRGQFQPTLPKGMTLISLSDAKKTLKKGDASLLLILRFNQSINHS